MSLQGLEATVLPHGDIKQLDAFYKKLLRQMQGLSESVATEAVYLLIGTLPIKAILHQRIFSLFGNICRLDRDEPLRQVAIRQLSITSEKSGSWFYNLMTLAGKYGIDIHSAIFFP